MLGWALHIFFSCLFCCSCPDALAQVQVPKRVNSSCWAAGRSHAGHKLAVSVYVSWIFVNQLSLTCLKFIEIHWNSGFLLSNENFDPCCLWYRMWVRIGTHNMFPCARMVSGCFISVFWIHAKNLKERPRKSEEGKFCLTRHGDAVICFTLDFWNSVFLQFPCHVNAY